MTDLPNIAFIGEAGAGKDTAAELLAPLGYRRLGFADCLRDVAELIWGPVARNDRDKLQRLGMAVRGIDRDAWVNVLLGRLIERDGVLRLPEVTYLPRRRREGDITGFQEDFHPVAVTDCRFANEAAALQGCGFVLIRVEADREQRMARLQANGKLGPEGWENHVSETDLTRLPSSYTVYNLADKEQLVDDIVKCINIERRAA